MQWPRLVAAFAYVEAPAVMSGIDVRGFVETSFMACLMGWKPKQQVTGGIAPQIATRQVASQAISHLVAIIYPPCKKEASCWYSLTSGTLDELS